MPPLTTAQREQAEADRLAHLAHQSASQDVAFVEIVYKNCYVQFDISTMQAQHLTAQQLLERCFAKPFADVHLPTQLAEFEAPAWSSSASETTTA